jgi:hypothetical protein
MIDIKITYKGCVYRLKNLSDSEKLMMKKEIDRAIEIYAAKNAEHKEVIEKKSK